MSRFFAQPARVKTLMLGFWALSLVALGGCIMHVLKKLCAC